MAVADDLYQWEKIAANPVTTIDTRYYDPAGWGARTWPHWRDPFLFEQGGLVSHYVCARAEHQGSEEVWGTVGLARTEDKHRWEVLPPPEVEPVTMELECPQLHRWGKRYYLVFSAAPFFFSEAFLADYPEKELR